MFRTLQQLTNSKKPVLEYYYSSHYMALAQMPSNRTPVSWMRCCSG